MATINSDPLHHEESSRVGDSKGEQRTRDGFDVLHDKQKRRFYILVQGRESYLDYDVHKGKLDLQSTFVSEIDRGKGIAAKLVEEALKYAQNTNHQIIPSCSYVDTYIKRHPRWQSLIENRESYQQTKTEINESHSPKESPKQSPNENENLNWLKSKVEVYWPLILLVGYSLLGAFVFQKGESNQLMGFMHYFMGFFFVGFSFFKLLDLNGFANAYQKYDLIAARYPQYGKIYPFIELALGAAYLSFFAPLLTYALTFIIMTVSSAGVIWAVMQGKKIDCGCMGTMFSLPMSSVTIFEDVSMATMALIMLLV